MTTFVVLNIKFFPMDTLVKPRTRRVMPGIAPRAHAPSRPAKVFDEDAIFASMFEDESVDFDEILDFLRHRPKPEKLLDNAFFIAQTQDILNGKQPTISRKEILQALAFGSVSDEIVDDLEDAILLKMMQEGDNELVSEEEIMKILDE